MGEYTVELEALAARLAGGPAFLIIGPGPDTDEIASVATYAWSGVYATGVEKTIADALRTDWRTVVSSRAMSMSPSRSRTELQVCYLFGGRHLPADEQPPADAFEEADARIRAIQELSRLTSETVTPRGVLVIDGWAPGDRLGSADLMPALRTLGQGQAHLFSADRWAQDPYVSKLASTGQLVTHAESLADSLASMEAVGAVKMAAPAGRERGYEHVIALGAGFAEIDVHIWNQIRRSARPVDLEILTPPVFSSTAARYQEFRAFAGAPEGSPRWRGIAAGMNLSRDFEADLQARATKVLLERERPNPIVLTGQTATGKSIALAALAMAMAKEGDFAVLHQSRRTVRPSVDDVDLYANWAEERGAKGTVFIWDGMVHPREYETFARQLHNRGRKVLVVGSAYKTDENLEEAADSAVVVAAAALSDSEAGRLVDLLASFEIPATRPTGALDASFLAFLYHTLPETEYSLRQGLALEMRAAEKGMAKLVRARGAEASPESRLTAMAAALQAAGLELADLSLESNDETPLAEQSFGERSSIQRVTTLVLVAGRHGIPVPIDLALRILGREGSQSIRDALVAFDILREIDDDSGDFYLGVRSHLEAELLAQHDIPLDVEIEVIAEAIDNVRIIEGFVDGADEVQFLVSLLERIGPNSRNLKYRPYFREVADRLRLRREGRGRAHPRLVLQESAFVRDFVHYQQSTGQGDPADRVRALEFNTDVLHDALASDDLRGMLRVSLHVELAATLGAIVHEFKNDDGLELPTSLTHSLDEILKAVLDARAVDPRNLHPVDVLAWSTRDAIETGVLDPAQRLDRLASAVAALESIDLVGLSESAQAKVDMRLSELQALLGNDNEAWQRLQSLEANQDPSATYFLAKFEAANGTEGPEIALQRLWSAPPHVQRDWRCAQLLLELAWEKITGFRLLRGERSRLHLSPAVVDGLSRIAVTLRDAELPDRYKLLFVEAVASFAMENYADAKNLFREVEGLTRQLSRRIHTVLVLADEQGEPLLYSGRVETDRGGWGRVFVEELGTSVWFETRLFSASQDFVRNQRLPGFIIGFKLTRGAVAEPRTMLRERPRP